MRATREAQFYIYYITRWIKRCAMKNDKGILTKYGAQKNDIQRIRVDMV